MHQELISIVIPVYNTEDYLAECLESVAAQTYANLEIIIVDDGSTDGSYDICRSFAGKETRTRLLRQENSGAASARKNGIQHAEGAYVCFVDSDDTVDSSMVEFFINNIGACDMITSGCVCEKKDGSLYQRHDSFLPGAYQTAEEMDEIICNMITFHSRMEDGLLPFLVNKMYRTSIIKDAVAGINECVAYAEDRDLLFRAVLRSRSIRITDKCFYHYRYRASSAMHTPSKNFMSDLNTLYLSLEEEFQKYPQRDALMHQLQLFIASRTYLITKYMGFGSETWSIRYIFPFWNLLDNKRIILYGAGIVGNNYYRQITVGSGCRIIAWVDRDWEKCRKNNQGINILSPDKISEFEFDYIVIAVKSREAAGAIKKDLTSHGIESEKLLWKPPIDIRI